MHAFDRDQRTVFRYVTEPDVWQWPVPTLFDAVGDREAVTVFEGRWDGPLTILTQYNLIGQAFLEAIGASALSGGDRGPVEAYLKLLRDGASPVVSLIVLNEFDMLAHFHGPQSAEAQRALSDSDALIGEILDALAHTTGSRGSLLDETSLVLFGDHGMAQSGHYIDLRDFFAERGLNAIDVATVGHVLFRERLGSLWTNWTDVILVAGGSNITQVYLKDPERGWRAPLLDGADHPGAENDHDTVSRLAPDLARREGIGQVFWLEALDVVRVLAGDGSRARVMARGEGPERVYAYLVEPDAESDPFGYLANPATRPLVCHGPSAASECFHSVTEWFDASVSTGYPGAVPLLPKAFRASQFAGDLMVAAARGYTFLRGQQGDHGNLDRQAMLTPLIFNGPGVSACQERHQPRLVDIYPSVAVLLGAARDDPALTDLDGRVLDCVANPASALRPGRRL
ncbi:MAG: alkaline phosphatase family protein [Pseudomonadales bacterium]